MVDQMGEASTEMAGAYREGSEWFLALSTFEDTGSEDAAATSMGLAPAKDKTLCRVHVCKMVRKPRRCREAH